jgi:chromosomal replication initiator protein
MDSINAWQVALGQLQMELPKSSYETWVKHAELVSYDRDTFTVGVQNAYARDWLENRVTGTVSKVLSGMMQRPQNVQFVVWHRERAEMESRMEIEPTASEPPARPHPVLNSRYTFENYVVGPSNRLAHAACFAVAESPAKAYNPLFLYGGVGLGKTHLLYAIGNKTLQMGLRILYVSSEEFTNDLINSIRTHTTQAFRDKYRQTDVLLIDDIQFIAGKESTQEEFFHTFNTLHSQNKQIVISSDRPPKAMNTLEERLRSRFEWGLAADIQPADLETRMAILRSKAERSNRQIPGDIIELIARQFQSNIRELEGALTRVLAFADLTSQPITIDLVNSALTDLLPQRREVNPQQIIEATGKVFGVSLETLEGRGRTAEVALPRQVAMYLLREEANLSFPQIGTLLGGRDHTTVMYACEKMAGSIEEDDQLRRKVVQVREILFGRK